MSLLAKPSFVAGLDDVATTTSSFAFLTQPVNRYPEYGTDTSFSATTNKDSSGTTFQWKHSSTSSFSDGGTNFSNGGDVSGATTTTLSLSNLDDTYDAKHIRLYATHSGTTIKSLSVVLNVSSEGNN